MSDNTTLNAGSGGDVIASDDISGVKYQRVKITVGDDGVNGGDVSGTNPIPASDATAQATLAAVQALNDTMLYMLTAMLDKMPRLDRNDRVNAMISDASGNELNSAYYGISSNLVGEAIGGKSYSRINEPWQFSNMGCLHIYNQISVS